VVSVRVTRETKGDLLYRQERLSDRINLAIHKLWERNCARYSSLNAGILILLPELLSFGNCTTGGQPVPALLGAKMKASLGKVSLVLLVDGWFDTVESQDVSDGYSCGCVNSKRRVLTRSSVNQITIHDMQKEFRAVVRSTKSR